MKKLICECREEEGLGEKGPIRYILEILKKEMKYTTDMLRYDSCYEVTTRNDSYRLHTLHFTPERWKSFGFVPIIIDKIKITPKEETMLHEQAQGFTNGLRFAQDILQKVLIEGGLSR